MCRVLLRSLSFFPTCVSRRAWFRFLSFFRRTCLHNATRRWFFVLVLVVDVVVVFFFILPSFVCDSQQPGPIPPSTVLSSMLQTTTVLSFSLFVCLFVCLFCLLRPSFTTLFVCESQPPPSLPSPPSPPSPDDLQTISRRSILLLLLQTISRQSPDDRSFSSFSRRSPDDLQTIS